MGLRPALVALQGLRALLGESRPQLKVALLAEAKLPRGFQGSHPFAFALDQHRQLASDLIIGADGQKATRPDQGLLFQIELSHDCLLRKRSKMAGRHRVPAAMRIAETAQKV